MFYLRQTGRMRTSLTTALAASPHTTKKHVFQSYAGLRSIPHLRWTLHLYHRVGMWRVTMYRKDVKHFSTDPPREPDVNLCSSSGSPELIALLVECARLSALRIPPIFYQAEFLPPFALWLAFPTSVDAHYVTDYYGGSVTIGLAPLRRSRSTVMRNVVRMT